jgi:4-hydroxybenzoate polyprenyltransferase
MINLMIRFVKVLKLNETLFALPFAYSGVLLAYKGFDDLDLSKIIWITLAMFGARTFGMMMNRLIDRHIDGINPRTKDRDLPSGRVKVNSVIVLALLALFLFMVSAFKLNNLAFYLAPFASIYMVFYSYTKRFTWMSSFCLGWVLAIAPSAAWIGINNSLSWEPVILSLSVALWATSFDIIYHIQDLDFYSGKKFYSFSSRFGVNVSLKLTKILDLLAVCTLILLGFVASIGWIYFVGPAVVGCILFYKHRFMYYYGVDGVVVKFFWLNSLVSVSIFCSILASLLIS